MWSLSIAVNREDRGASRFGDRKPKGSVGRVTLAMAELIFYSGPCFSLGSCGSHSQPQSGRPSVLEISDVTGSSRYELGHCFTSWSELVSVADSSDGNQDQTSGHPRATFPIASESLRNRSLCPIHSGYKLCILIPELLITSWLSESAKHHK